MKQLIITALFTVAVGSAFAQQHAPIDTNVLKSNLQKIEAARTVILKRDDISIADGVLLLNGLQAIYQRDSDSLTFERSKKIPAEPKKKN